MIPIPMPPIQSRSYDRVGKRQRDARRILARGPLSTGDLAKLLHGSHRGWAWICLPLGQQVRRAPIGPALVLEAAQGQPAGLTATSLQHAFEYSIFAMLYVAMRGYPLPL
jgi:hypothetical protein